MRADPLAATTPPLSEIEQRAGDAVAEREHELVELVQALIRFDTVTHSAAAPPRDEAAVQEFLAARLRAAGADVSVAEPDPALVAGHRMIPDGVTFAGRPQLVARFTGSGGGRTLLLNGHVDVVAPEPLDAWRHDPFAGVVEDGAVHGRGACDMKGGVACIVVAAEALARCKVPLDGDLLVNVVTDEESTGAGGLASALTLQADGAIVTEPTRLDVSIACRGSVLPRIVVEGRASHAGIARRHPGDGGPVNANEKAALVLDAISRLREEWALQPRHRYLSPPDCVPTIIRGGEWLVSHPASCSLDCHVEYLPGQADSDGWGSEVEREFVEWIQRAADADPWLAGHPPRVEWAVGAVPPAEVPADDPVVEATLGAARATGIESRLSGLDTWHDAATLTVEGGIRAICFGPGDIHLAHTASESVPIDDLVACAQALAVAAIRFCGGRGA